MTVLDGGASRRFESLTDRRRPSVAPRRSWASAHPVDEHPRPTLRELDQDWQSAVRRYVRQCLVLDAAVGLAAVLLGCVLWQVFGQAASLWALAVAVVYVVAVALGRGYDRRHVGAGPGEFQAIMRAGVWAAAAVALAGAATVTPVPRGLVAFTVLLQTFATAVCRYVLRKGLHARRSAGAGMARTLVVGDAASAHEVIEDLRAAKHHGYRVIGLCLPSIADIPPADGVRTFGAFADVAQVAYDERADVVIVAGGGLAGDGLRRLSWALGRIGVELVVAPGLVEVLGPRLQLRPTAGLSLLEVETAAPRRRMLAKAALDRVLGTLMLLVASPVILGSALVVRLTSPGPAFFKQCRIGVDGREFTLLKLRSMYVDAEARRAALLHRSDRDGLMFKMHDDPRVTRVGRVLRRFSIDELPQLWNVVRGDMSLVGPRPPLPQEVAEYEDVVFRRLRVRPGLTGLWQVSGRSDLSWEESVRLDLRYVDNWSVAMDLLILWKTGRAVFSSAGAY
jgi:exopolysaccharide biosynthesis polyprenyl glycosylphosphotransferase